VSLSSGDEIGDGMLDCRSLCRLEHELIQTATASQNIRHRQLRRSRRAVVPWMIDSRPSPPLFEMRGTGVAGAEAVGDGKVSLSVKGGLSPGIVDCAPRQSAVDFRQRAGSGMD